MTAMDRMTWWWFNATPATSTDMYSQMATSMFSVSSLASLTLLLVRLFDTRNYCKLAVLESRTRSLRPRPRPRTWSSISSPRARTWASRPKHMINEVKARAIQNSYNKITLKRTRSLSNAVCFKHVKYLTTNTVILVLLCISLPYIKHAYTVVHKTWQ